MAEQFISPNWHVILIHYPLGLLAVGILIEFFSFLGWRRSGFRTAGRWMILLGALLAIPTVTSGLYAFRQVSVPSVEPVEGHWNELVKLSPWSARQWDMMTDHLVQASVATGLFVLVAVIWVAASERRRKGYVFYYFLMLVLLVAMGLIASAAWHSGESIYRDGTAVGVTKPTAELPTDSVRPGHDAEHEHATEAPAEGYHWVEFYVPPLQAHVVLAGLTVALGLAALGLSVKRWDRVISSIEETPRPLPPVSSGVSEPRPATQADVAGAIQPPKAEFFLVRPRVFPGRYWLLAALLAILTAVAGVWSVGGLTWAEAEPALKLIREPDHQRLFWHVAAGAALIVLPLLLAIIVRFTREAKFVTSLLSLLFVLCVGWQVWLGILMLYDSHEGPLTGFSRTPPATTAPGGQH